MPLKHRYLKHVTGELCLGTESPETLWKDLEQGSRIEIGGHGFPERVSRTLLRPAGTGWDDLEGSSHMPRFPQDWAQHKLCLPLYTKQCFSLMITH